MTNQINYRFAIGQLPKTNYTSAETLNIIR